MSISTGSIRTTNEDDLEAPLIPHGRWIPFLVVTPLFFLWAIPNNLTDFLIRQFMKSFEINRSGAAQLQIGIFIGYFLMAIPAGQIMRWLGYKAGLITGLILMGSGCWLFWPAARLDSYIFFVTAQFVIGCGLSFLETGANSFIAQLGPAASSERRLNLSQAFNPLGSITAGLVGTVFIFSGVEFTGAETAAKRAAGTMQAYLHSETMRVVPTYLVLGTVALLWALMVLVTKFPALSGEEDLVESVTSIGSDRSITVATSRVAGPSPWSFDGRIGRASFWTRLILVNLLAYSAQLFAYQAASGRHFGPASFVLPPLYIAGAWFGLATQVKRWHDLGHSGWMALWNLTIIAIPFTFIYTGCFKGTLGPNSFGGEPVLDKLERPSFVFAVLAQFLYVGAQVGSWSYFILYVRLATGAGDKFAGSMLTGALAMFAVGRFSSPWLMKHFHARTMLGVYAVVNVVLGLVAVVQPNWVGTWCLLATNVFMSIMFPTIFAMGLKGMGDKTKTAGSLLVMAILGGAALTKVMGMLADASSLQMAYVVPVVCFAGVALYAWFGGEAEGQQVSKSAS